MNKLSFGYKPKIRVLRDLDLDLTGGHIYGLLGRNGAGKTTLIKVLSGLLNPHVGTVNSMNYIPFRRDTAFLEQCYFLPDETFSPLDSTVGAHADFESAFYPSFDRNLHAELLRTFEVASTTRFKALSHGDRKKAHVSFALATQAKILLLDEPTNGLDIPGKGLFKKALSQAFAPDRCIVVSTHQVKDIEGLIDSAIIIEQGSVVFDHDLTEVAQRISMSVGHGDADDPSVIYRQDSIAGVIAVRRSVDGTESALDLEVLFNAAMHNREMLCDAIRKDIRR